MSEPHDLRTCSTCRSAKPHSEFYVEMERRRSESAGRRVTYSCRDCQSARAKRGRADKLAAVAARKATGCVDCGLIDLTHPEVFDFDHVDPGVKSKSISALMTSGTMDDLVAEMDKCEIVCANCHRIRTKSRAAVTRGRDRKC